MRKIIFVLSICMIIAFMPIFEATAQNDNPAALIVIDDEYSQIASNDSLSLLFNEKTTNFRLQSKADGYIWYSAPKDIDSIDIGELYKAEMASNIIVEYRNIIEDVDDRINSYSGSVELGDYECKKIKNGVEIVYSFKELAIKIPLSITLSEEALSVNILTEKISYDSEKLIIKSIAVLPYLGAGESNEDGYVFLPDGSGAVVNFNKNRSNLSSYEKAVYGNDIGTTSENSYNGITAPVYGISRNNQNMLAVIADNSEDAVICCNGNGQSTPYTNVYAKFVTTAQVSYSLQSQSNITVYEDGKIKAPKLSVDYYFLKGEKNGYAQMAEKYRSLIFDNEKLASAKVEEAIFLDLYAAVRNTKSVWGIKFDYNCILTSLTDVEIICNQLKEKGVNNTVIRYNGCDTKEIENNIIKKFSWNKKLGKNLLKKMEDFKQKGIVLYPAISSVETYKSSSNPLHTLTVAARDISDSLIMLKQGINEENSTEFYVIKYDNLKKNTDKLFSSIEKQDITSFAFSDLGNLLYSDFNGDGNKRPSYSSLIAKRLDTYTKEGNSLLLDNPNIYAAVFADEIINLPTSLAEHDIIDEAVPFMQMLYSGIIRYSSEAVNLAANKEELFLKTIETGSMPNFSLIGRDASLLVNTDLSYLYSSEYKNWLKTATEQYLAISEIVEKTDGSILIDHFKLGDKLYASVYKNGVAVVVNYSESAQLLKNGTKVEAMSYVVVKEEQI